MRRVNITDAGRENLLDYLDLERITILPNTAGCYTAAEAIRTGRLAREAGVGSLVKLEVIGDEKTLFPDVPATLEAAQVLVKEGFTVLPYINDDPIAALRLAGPRLRGGDAAGGADRLGPGHPQPLQHSHHPRAESRPGDRRRRRRHGLRRRRRRWSWAATPCC